MTEARDLKGRDREMGSSGGNNQPPRRQTGDLRSAVSSASEIRVGVLIDERSRSHSQLQSVLINRKHDRIVVVVVPNWGDNMNVCPGCFEALRRH